MKDQTAINLCEWNSNCFEFLKLLPSCEKSAVSDATNVLGLSWDQFQDTINISGFENDIMTHDVLHSVANIFDLLGVISSIIFHEKLFLQKFCVVERPWHYL